MEKDDRIQQKYCTIITGRKYHTGSRKPRLLYACLHIWKTTKALHFSHIWLASYHSCLVNVEPRGPSALTTIKSLNLGLQNPTTGFAFLKHNHVMHITELLSVSLVTRLSLHIQIQLMENNLLKYFKASVGMQHYYAVKLKTTTWLSVLLELDDAQNII